MLIKMEVESSYTGKLQVNVVTRENVPVRDATVTIAASDSPNNIIERLTTNSSGQTETIELPAPPIELSLNEANTTRPYTTYNIRIEALGYETEFIENAEILPDVLAIQNVRLTSKNASLTEDIMIPDHTLYGEYPPKVPEEEIKPVNEPGEIVLSRVVVPEIIVVHDGIPSDSSAQNYYVNYRDYIKNVASSEIYATWPTATIEANVLAIMSFTLNRVYTEWYRNKGYDFTITSSTAYDQKWIYDQYLSRPDVRQPILTQYCDGKRVTCPNWLSQWGSCNLGERGYSTIEIIRYYYGDDMYINTAEQIAGIPISWPGYDLDIGASGQKVAQIQEQLDTIAQVYTEIPRLNADGIYGENTRDAVKAFHKIFDLPQTGIVDFATWYKISQIYVGITRIAEGIPR